MKIFILGILVLYLGVLLCMYNTQDSRIFNSRAIEKNEPVKLENVQKISLHVDKSISLEGMYKKSQIKNAPLIIYFGGNSDDSTRILLHTKTLTDFDILSFNYRGFVNSQGKPSEKVLFSDAIDIVDKYGFEREVILIGRSLGTGVASYVASLRDVKGVILITPYDSILSVAKRDHPYLPVDSLLKHRFESIKYIQNVKTPIGLIEVKDDKVVKKYHFDKLKEKVQNIALHVELKDTTHGKVLIHPDFEDSLKKIIERF